MPRTNRARIMIQLLSPAVHLGDEKTGAEALFRRLKFVVGNEIVEVPYISGNELRGQLRRVVMKDFLELAEYEVKSLRLFHSLFSGGVLEEIEEKATPQLDIELRRKIRSLMPPVSLFGLAIANQVIEGKLKVMHILPICKELADYLPSDIVTAVPMRSLYDYLDWTFHTRHAKERRANTEEPAVQMLYRFEVLIPGTPMYTEIICEDCNEVELSCLARAVELWRQRPFIGGRSSSGYGKIKFVKIDTDFPLDSSKYIEFVKRNKADIQKVLSELDK